MAQPTNTETTADLSPAIPVVFTDVIDALVSPVPVADPDDPVDAEVAPRLRAVRPSDHDTVALGSATNEVVLMEDFAGELRRWLATATK